MVLTLPLRDVMRHDEQPHLEKTLVRGVIVDISAAAIVMSFLGQIKFHKPLHQSTITDFELYRIDKL